MVRLIVDGHAYAFTRGEAIATMCFDATWVTAVVWWRIRRHRAKRAAGR